MHKQAQQLTNLRLLEAGPEREKSERPSTTCSSSFLFPANPTIVSSTRTRGPAKSRRGTRRFLEKPAGIEGWRTSAVRRRVPRRARKCCPWGFRFARRGILGEGFRASDLARSARVRRLAWFGKVCWLARAGGMLPEKTRGPRACSLTDGVGFATTAFEEALISQQSKKTLLKTVYNGGLLK
jgi:hypothetical protein